MNLAYAISIAAEWHRTQVDKAGDPYILHPLRVMSAVRAAGFNTDYQIVAVLHDIVEDTYYNSNHLSMYGSAIEAGVLAITRLYDPLPDYFTYDEQGARAWGKPRETYQEYFERCVKNPIARAVKYYDILDNMDPKRFREGVPYERYVKGLAWYKINGVADWS